jgi:hypothetical protein
LGAHHSAALGGSLRYPYPADTSRNSDGREADYENLLPKRPRVSAANAGGRVVRRAGGPGSPMGALKHLGAA